MLDHNSRNTSTFHVVPESAVRDRPIRFEHQGEERRRVFWVRPSNVLRLEISRFNEIGVLIKYSDGASDILPTSSADAAVDLADSLAALFWPVVEKAL